MCYASSTLFHSSFTMPQWFRHWLHISDQCAIYLLIAGSYTPFLIALFPTGGWSVWVLAYIWTLAAIGSAMEVMYHHARRDKRWLKIASLVLYVAMGWSAAWPPLLRDMRAAMDPDAFKLLLGGGLAYTLGVPVFVRNRGLDHALWHLFVLAGSGLHFAALWRTVEGALRGTL